MRMLLKGRDLVRRRASTPRRGAGLEWGLVAAAKKESVPHVVHHPTWSSWMPLTLRPDRGTDRRREDRVYWADATPVGRLDVPGTGLPVAAGAGRSMPIGWPCTSGPGSGTVAGPAPVLTRVSVPKSTRAAVSRPSSA